MRKSKAARVLSLGSFRKISAILPIGDLLLLQAGTADGDLVRPALDRTRPQCHILRSDLCEAVDAVPPIPHMLEAFMTGDREGKKAVLR